MATLLAMLNLALLLLTTLLQGELRYFDVNTKKGIAPLAVTFNASTIYNAKLGQKFIWTFGNGEALTTTSATTVYTYRVAGTYTAKLKYLKNATDAVTKAVDGGSATIVVQPGTVVTNTPPVPQLTCTSNVVGKVECNAAGSVDNNGTIVSYKYEWGDSAVDTKTDASAIVHTYSTTGSKTIKLTVTDNAGATGVISKTVQVKENLPPVAAMTCTTTNMTANCNATASTDPDGQGLSYSFNFGDGAVVSSTNGLATHTYTVAANYQIKVTVTDTFGATAIAAAQTSPSQPTPPRGYFNYEQDGTFITLKAFIRKTQYEIAKAYYVVDGNQNNKIQLSNFYSNAINYVEMNTFGNHNITMYVEDMAGQKYETSIGIYILDDIKYMKPYLRFFGNQSGPRKMYYHLGRSFIPLKNEIIKNFKIDFGDGQSANLVDTAAINHTYAAAGTYNVKVEAEYKGNVQSSTFSMVVTNDDILQVPVAEFQYLIHDFAGNVTFADERSGTPNGEIISYVWDYGDGAIGYGKKAVHFFTAPGVYLVKLTVTDTMGLTNSMTQQVTVVGGIDDVAVNLDCKPVAVKTSKCNITAVDQFDEIVRVKVEWGDGTSEVLTNPAIPEWGNYLQQHAYQGYGDFVVGLTVNTSRGKTKTISIHQYFYAPVASLNCNAYLTQVYCDGLASYDPGGGALIYKINWGDGVEESFNHPYLNHVYAQAGLYNATLTVENTIGDSSSATRQLMIVTGNVNANPSASFYCGSTGPYTLKCLPSGSYDPDGSIVSYEYFYNDGYYEFKSTSDEVYLIFSSGGSKDITLKVTDNRGGVGTAVRSIDVYENHAPLVEALQCTSMEFNKLNCFAYANAMDNSDSIINYSWDMGDGKPIIQGMIPSINDYFYETPGEKIIQVTVTDQYGKTATREEVVTVRENLPPVALVTCQSPGVNRLDCIVYANDPDYMGPLTYEWKFNGSIISIENQFTVKVLGSGMGIVELKITDATGAFTIKEQYVLISPNQDPISLISCINQSGTKYTCTGEYSSDDSEIVKYVWTIDGQTIEGKSILYEFTDGGEKVVQLKVVDDMGAEGVSERVLSVNKLDLAFVCHETGILKVTCDASQIDANNATKLVYFRYEFDQEDFSEEAVASYEFKSFGLHKIKLTAVDQYGEISSREINFNFTKSYLTPNPVFNYESDLSYVTKFDAGESLAQSREIVNYKWSFGDDTSVIETKESVVIHNFQNEGSYNVSLTVTDKNGAQATKLINVYAYDAEVPDPGEAVHDTILGIDTDGDGVRDDVQRWISFEAKNNASLKNLLKKIGKNYQEQFQHADDVSAVKALSKKEEYLEICLSSRVTAEDFKRLKSIFKMLHFNTEARVKASVQILDYRSGMVSEGSLDMMTPEKYCQQI